MAKVLVVSIVYPPDTVSTANVAAGLAGGLRSLGHDVGVLTSVPHYNPPAGMRHEWWRPVRREDEAGVAVVRCYTPRKPSQVLRRLIGFGILHSTLTLGALRHFRDRDVVIVISPPFTFAFVAFVLRRLRGTRFIYNAQELWPDVPRDLGVITSERILGILRRCERLIYRSADSVVAIGEGFADEIRARGATSVSVIPNFVDTSWISPQPKRNPLAIEWGLDGRPVALYAGNIGLTQDFELLLRAAAEVPDVEFVIVGGGSGRQDLQGLLSNGCPPNVQLRDFVPRGRVPELYGLADVVVVPLRAPHDRTTTPSKLLSAIAARRPVLVCASAGTDAATTVTSHGAGVVVEPGNVRAFCEALACLLDGGAESNWDPDRAALALHTLSPEHAARRYDQEIARLT